jgi:NADH-quinone oxidoreductase subunit J
MGAIMVLFLFVLMLLNLNEETEPLKPTLLKVAGVVAGMCLLVTLAGSLKALSVSEPVVLQNANLGLVKNLGKVLFNEFLLPFEISSLLLLSAMVGAVLLAKKEA